MGKAEDVLRARRAEAARQRDEAAKLAAAPYVEELRWWIEAALDKLDELGFPEMKGMGFTKWEGEELVSWTLYYHYHGEGQSTELYLLSNGIVIDGYFRMDIAESGNIANLQLAICKLKVLAAGKFESR